MYLGIDCSTQSLKLLLLSDSLDVIVHEVSINYAQRLPHYKTSDGVTRSTYGLPRAREESLKISTNPLIVSTPSLMLVEALDLALKEMHAACPQHLARVRAISASGQQHGSVWWRTHAQDDLLRRYHADLPLAPQLKDAFALPNAPIWMDSSTLADCQALEAAIPGGAQALATITGSKAFERFTGNQIRKLRALLPDVYQRTERISLISSMLACLMLGEYAPIDASDGAGMNMMDISTLQWDTRLLNAIDPTQQLHHKLGTVVNSSTVLGFISSYFVKRYGFDAKCRIVASTGDNPSTLAGMQLAQPGDVGVSLGTSDTLFAVVENAKPSQYEGHVFVNPCTPSTYMLMTVFKNGSLTRERIRDQFANKSWTEFNASLDSTRAGCDGCMKFTYLESEITPTTHSTGTFRFDSNGSPIAKLASNQLECRALIEAQFISMRAHASHLGLSAPKRIVASGGASINRHLLQVLANVFQAPVYVQVVRDSKTQRETAVSNTAALGAAYRAAWAVDALHSNDARSRRDSLSASSTIVLAVAAEPDRETKQVYEVLSRRFGALEDKVCRDLKKDEVVKFASAL